MAKTKSLSDKAYNSYMRFASPSYRKEQDSPAKPRPGYDANATKERYENKALVKQRVREAEREVEKKYRKGK